MPNARRYRKLFENATARRRTFGICCRGDGHGRVCHDFIFSCYGLLLFRIINHPIMVGLLQLSGSWFEIFGSRPFSTCVIHNFFHKLLSSTLGVLLSTLPFLHPLRLQLIVEARRIMAPYGL